MLSRTLLLLPAFWIPITILAQGALFSMDTADIRRRLVADVAVLAADSLEGREAGTRGEHKAASYIRSQFTALGLIPKGSLPQSFDQPFSKLSVSYYWATSLRVNNRDYRYRRDFSVTALSGNGSAKGALADGRQGLVVPELGMDQLSPLGDLRGKIVLVDLQLHAAVTADTTLEAKLTPGTRMKTLLQRGAAGVIFWNGDAKTNRGLFNFEGCDTLPGLALYAGMETAKELLKEQGRVASITVKVERSTHWYTNVAGYIDNRAPNTVIIGAHYDHTGLEGNGKINYGADDNASGAAGMLELARHFSTHRDTVYNYLFIGFSAEEKGLLGSEHFAKNPTVNLDSVHFMLNLDMIGRLGTRENRLGVAAAGSSPQWRRLISKTPHPSFRVGINNASLPYSDHYPFYQKGIPALFFSTGLHDDYHTPNDRAALLNYDGMVTILQFVTDLVDVSRTQPVIQHRKVSGFTQTTATIGLYLQALGWMMTIR